MVESIWLVSLAEGAGKELAGLIYNDLKKVLKGFTNDKLQVIADSIVASASRLDKTKTIYPSNSPLSLCKLYVNENFELDDDEVCDQELIQRLRDNQKMIVEARGGAGKSWFMKYAFCQIALEPQFRVPIFFELRKSTGDKPLFESIAESFAPSGGLSGDDIQKLCEKGRAILMLDGFDEVAKANRDKVAGEILKLANAHQNIGLVVSTRPDDELSKWAQFHLYKTKPLTYSQFCELIGKTPFDEEVKKGFLEQADESYFEQYSTLVSVPLIAAMLLLIYQKNAALPTNQIEFYEQYVDVLYQQHDATKELFRREHALSKDVANKFAEIIAVYGLFMDKFEFTKSDLEEWLSAKTITPIAPEASLQDVLKELDEHINLLIREGDVWRFVHRSFQEYFAGRYVVMRLDGERLEKALAKLYDHPSSSFSFAYQIDGNKVYQHFLNDKIEALRKARPFQVPPENPTLEDAFKVARTERYLMHGRCELGGIRFGSIKTWHTISMRELDRFNVKFKHRLFQNSGFVLDSIFSATFDISDLKDSLKNSEDLVILFDLSYDDETNKIASVLSLKKREDEISEMASVWSEQNNRNGGSVHAMSDLESELNKQIFEQLKEKAQKLFSDRYEKDCAFFDELEEICKKHEAEIATQDQLMDFL